MGNHRHCVQTWQLRCQAALLTGDERYEVQVRRLAEELWPLPWWTIWRQPSRSSDRYREEILEVLNLRYPWMERYEPLNH